MSPDVTALNYTTHAIDDLRLISAHMRPKQPQTSLMYDKIINLLRVSVKFILPNEGDFIEKDSADTMQKLYDLFRLPFPETLFEIPWNVPDTHEAGIMAGEKMSRSTRRIALCIQHDSSYAAELVGPDVHARNLSEFPAGGAYIIAVYHSEPHRTWAISVMGSFVPYDQDIVPAKVMKTMKTGQIIAAALENANVRPDKKKSNTGHVAVRFPIHVELCEKQMRLPDVDKFMASVDYDTRSETACAIEACAVMNCLNINSVEIKASKVLNKIRQSKNKTPMFDCRILTLAPGNIYTNDAGGTHASPISHLRRGHIRRISTNEGQKLVFVRSTLVKGRDYVEGVQVKTYAVEAPEFKLPDVTSPEF